jgi:hypothetical protein
MDTGVAVVVLLPPGDELGDTTGLPDPPVKNIKTSKPRRGELNRARRTANPVLYFRDAWAIASRKAIAATWEPTALRWSRSEAYPSYSAKYSLLS